MRPEDVHEVLRQKLAQSLEERPDEPPREAEVLDRYEALIEHTRLAGKVQEAIELYWYGMGGWENLGAELGEYRRGKRILEAFSPDGSPARCAEELPAGYRSVLINDWGLFAQLLGDLALAQRCMEEAILIDRHENDTKSLCTGLHNIADLAWLQGRFSAMARHAEEAVHWAKEENDPSALTNSHAYRAFAAFLAGKIPSARGHFAEATRFEGRPLFSLCGIQELEFRLRIGERAGALERSRQNLAICEKEGRRHLMARVHLQLGHLLLHESCSEARQYLTLSRTYAIRTGDLEVTLRAHLLAAAIQLHENHPDLAHAEAAEGFLLADNHGAGHLAIDLLVVLAQSSLARKSPTEAIDRAKLAHSRSIVPECGYAWGEADALHLLGLAHRDLGQREIARDHFKRAADLRARIEDPEAEASRKEAAALND